MKCGVHKFMRKGKHEQPNKDKKYTQREDTNTSEMCKQLKSSLNNELTS